MRIDRLKLITELAKRDIKQTHLAQLTGISRTTISNIVSGKSCSDETGNRIAEVLDISVEKILED